MKVVVTLAVIALVLGMVLAGLLWHESRLEKQRVHEVVEDTREEARKLVHMCELGTGFGTKINMGTSHFFEYFHTDLAKAGDVLAKVVDPVIEAQDYACTSAQTLIKDVQRDAETPDRWIDNASDKVVANLVVIARTRKASAALKTAIATQADLATLEQRLDELRTAAKAAASPDRNPE